MADQDRGRSGSEGNNQPSHIQGNLAVQGTLTVSHPHQTESGATNPYTNNNSTESTFHKVTTIVGIIVAAAVGSALFCVSYWQYSVYTQQAEIMKTQNRAFVSVPALYFVNTTPDRRWRVSVAFKNNGETQTQDLVVRPLMGGVGQDGAEPWSANIRRIAVGIPWLLGPKEDSRIELPTMDANVNEGTAINVIYGVVDYDDVLPNTKHHFTEFCFIFRGLGGNTSTAPTYNRWRLHNCADDQCYRQRDTAAPTTDGPDAP